MKIKVNGQEQEVKEGCSVLALLEGMKLSPERVAVEVNRRLVRSANYSAALQSGDEVEIVTFVGGG